MGTNKFENPPKKTETEEESTIESRSKKVLAGEISREQWDEKIIIELYDKTKKEMKWLQPTKKELRSILEGVEPKEEIDDEIFDETVKRFRKEVLDMGKYVLFNE